MRQKVVIVDIDHTVADAYWRDPMIGNWEEYYTSGAADLPIVAVVAIIAGLRQIGWYVLALTARPEKWRKATIDWCLANNVEIDEILMRGEGDHRPSTLVKTSALVTKFGENVSEHVDLALEDRDDIVAAYRSLGITTLQVFGGGCGVAPGPLRSPEPITEDE